MKNKIVLLMLFLSVSPAAVFSADLQQQLSNVAQAENQGQAEEQARWDDYQAREEAYYRYREAERNKRIAAANARARAREAERLKDKHRDQNYEDQLRQLSVDKKKLELQQLQARTAHENEFIAQDLKQQAAQTDVTQSQADANRNLSQGSQAKMISEGKAQEIKAGKWFN
ncbi:hypothetical protein A9993_00330 [Rahnella victoriana]|uniref:DUF5384 family protein n=1 Tax=Rahnella victoriana TaxID=1510570 RepID=UPI000BDC6174|nr:DUF5384 family protein [Rahnella victoriana]PBI78257.1 hypothetical protein A9993_00330 [Rahnella victoriana]